MGEDVRKGILGRWNVMNKDTEIELCLGNDDKVILVRE